MNKSIVFLFFKVGLVVFIKEKTRQFVLGSGRLNLNYYGNDCGRLASIVMRFHFVVANDALPRTTVVVRHHLFHSVQFYQGDIYLYNSDNDHGQALANQLKQLVYNRFCIYNIGGCLYWYLYCCSFHLISFGKLKILGQLFCAVMFRLLDKNCLLIYIGTNLCSIFGGLVDCFFYIIF